MIPRLLAPIRVAAADKSPVVAVMGPRQSGKTTLVRAPLPVFAYANPEDPELRALARQDPKSFLFREPGHLAALLRIETPEQAARGRVPTPVEIKASRTYSADQPRGLRRFAGLVPEAAPGWLVLGESEDARV